MTICRILLAVSVLSLGACTQTVATTLPAAPVPVSWPVGDAYLTQNEAALPVVSYTDVFTDRRLQQIIETALENNRDLRVAAANVAAARAQVRVTRSEQFPEVGVGGSAEFSRSSSASGAFNRGTDTNFSLQGGVSSFEVDLFGQLANATESERNQLLSTEAAARTIRLGLIGDIATAWATYAADQDFLAVAQATAKNATESVRLTDLRLRGGVAPRTDLAQAQQVLASAQLSIAEQQTAIAQDRNLLRLLVGAEVNPALLPGGLGEIEDAFASLPAGLDSRVLLRRPDIIEAEYLLRAAHADIAVARAEMFPSLSLTGLLGLASSALTNLFTGGALTLNTGADVDFTLFDAGGRRANVAVSEAQRDAALANYERAIQSAFREIADALADQGTLGERERAARANAEAATTTAQLAEARYKGGIDSFLDSLIAQRSLVTARGQLVDIQLVEILNRTTLYRVLGGDQATPER